MLVRSSLAYLILLNWGKHMYEAWVPITLHYPLLVSALVLSSSLQLLTHKLATEIPEDGTLRLSGPFEYGKCCLSFVSLKY